MGEADESGDEKGEERKIAQGENSEQGVVPVAEDGTWRKGEGRGLECDLL